MAIRRNENRSFQRGRILYYRKRHHANVCLRRKIKVAAFILVSDIRPVDITMEDMMFAMQTNENVGHFDFISLTNILNRYFISKTVYLPAIILRTLL